jgi:hypothetical protein
LFETFWFSASLFLPTILFYYMNSRRLIKWTSSTPCRRRVERVGRLQHDGFRSFSHATTLEVSWYQPAAATLDCSHLQAWCSSNSDADFDMLEKYLSSLKPEETILVGGSGSRV